MCTDCHSRAKAISKIERREIIVREIYQVHRFKDGFCSCGDKCWANSPTQPWAWAQNMSSWLVDYALKASWDEKTRAQKLYCMHTSELLYKVEGNIKKPFKVKHKSANGCWHYQFCHCLTMFFKVWRPTSYYQTKKRVPFIARVEFNALSLGNIRAWPMMLIQTEINLQSFYEKVKKIICAHVFESQRKHKRCVLH